MTDEDEWVDMIKRLRQNIADINQEFRKSVLKERITARRRPASEQDVAIAVNDNPDSSFSIRLVPRTLKAYHLIGPLACRPKDSRLSCRR